MRKKLIFCAWIFISVKIHAQINFVPNSSFEYYNSCPSTSGQILNAIPWKNPTNGTPDYMNSCSTSFGVPSYCNCNSVFQYPNSGNAYAGIWCFNYSSNTREYIQTKLLDSLYGCYYVSFYVNLINWAGVSCNNIGCYFSEDSIYNISATVLNYPSQIKNFKNKIITDTLGWTKIQGVFISTGNEKYITIGNFNDDSTTDTLIINLSSGFGAYFNIDDVSVISIDSMPGGMPAFAGNDTSVTIGDSVFIGQEISNLNCNWYNASGTLIANNISGISVNPTTTTYYVVEQNLCGTITYDTVNVVVLPLGVKDIKFKNEVNIYPNPSTGIIYISSMNLSHGDITVKDLTGKILFSRSNVELNQGFTELNIIAENGIYFIHIRNSIENEEIIKKIIISK